MLNKQTKDVNKIEGQIQLMNKTGLKIEKKVKYLSITVTNTNCMLFQNAMLRHRMKF